MLTRNTSLQPVNTTTPIAASNSASSGISRPAVQPYQKVSVEKYREDENHDGQEKTTIEPFQLKSDSTGQTDQVAPAQEKHPSHEAWHIAQQKQGNIPPVIQLKTGFEMELDVPAYLDPPATRKPQLTGEALTATEERDVQAFIGGGLEYSYVYGAHPMGLYHLTADHSNYKNKHVDFVVDLIEKNKVTYFMFRAMSNLEYVTPPIEEVAANQADEMADGIQAHATDTTTKAKSGRTQKISDPARDIFTGVPVAALKKLVGNDDGLKGQIDALADSVKGTVYFQESTGVLPSEIPALFDQASAEIYAKHKHQLGLTESGTTEEQYEQLPATEKERIDTSKQNIDVKDNFKPAYAKAALLAGAVSASGEFPLPDNTPPGDTAAIRGFLALVSQYLIASQLEEYRGYDGGTQKNRVAYLSRTELEVTRSAMPPTAITVLETAWQTEKNQQALISKAMNIAKAIRANAALTTKNTSAAFKPEVLGLNDQLGNLNKIILGQAAPSVKPGSLLELDKIEKKGNELKFGGQKLIPVEDRDLGRKLTDKQQLPENASGVLKSRWNKAFERRQTSLTDAAKLDIAAMRDQGRDKLSLMVNVISYQIGQDEATEMQLRIDQITPFLEDPDKLTAGIASGLEATFPGITALEIEIRTTPVDRKNAVSQFFITLFSDEVAAILARKMDEQDSPENRAEIHGQIALDLGKIKGISHTADSWDPVIEVIPDAGSGAATYGIYYDNDLKQLFNKQGDAVFFTRASEVSNVYRKTGADIFKLKYAGLDGTRNWEKLS